MILRDYQRQGCRAIFNAIAVQKSKATLCAMPTGCHAKGARIVMHDLTVKNVEDVVVGDRLMGHTGDARTVLALARGRQEMVKIYPNKGDPFVVNADHNVFTYIHNKFAGNDAAGYRVRRLSAISAYHRSAQKFVQAKAIEAAPNELPCSPWFMGAFLGDGSFSADTVSYVSADHELFARFKSESIALGAGVREQKRGKLETLHLKTPSGRFGKRETNSVALMLEDLGLKGHKADRKFIPEIFKRGSLSQRLELLAGLLDTDGHQIGPNGFEFTTVGETLARDFLFVARSCGFRCSYRINQGRYKIGEKRVETQHYYRIVLSGCGFEQTIPTLRKKFKPQVHSQIKNPRHIGALYKDLPEDDYFGFTLDGDQLYVTDDFIIHHNTGKALINADFAGGIVSAYAGQRVLCVTHSKTLVKQNAATFKLQWPNVEMGIVSAGLGLRQYGNPVTFAGIGSVYKKPQLLGRVTVLIVDEAHAISDASKSMYAKLIAALKKANPELVVIGLTATPYRMGMGMLTDGELFTDVCIDMTSPEWIAWFVSEGYLLPLVAKKTSAFIDTDSVKLTAGDFNQKELSNAAMRNDMTEKAIAEALPALAGRKSIAIYCVSIEHVMQVVMSLDSYGIDAEYVHSKMDADHNDAALERFANGESRFVVSMGQLTTGWDCPRLDAIVMLRPTRSPGLWVQMLGRGTRPFFFLDAYLGTDGVWRVPDIGTREGRTLAIARSQKHDCLVLDFARNTETIGPFDDPQTPKKRGKGGGDAIMKACQKGRMVDSEYIGCGRYAWPAERHCKDCGHEFYFEVKFDSTTTGAAIMKGRKQAKEAVEPQIAEFDVARVTYLRHSKAGKPDSIKVVYNCGMRQFNMFLCPDHGGGATARARMWWRKHIDATPPHGIETWLERMDEARIPTRITVKLKTDWPDIIDWSYE